jgi:hypothetical protein
MRAFSVSCLLAVTLATSAGAIDGPPPPVHWSGDHWTAWNPPPTPPPGPGVHIVEKGDTLWDLAAKNLGNPYLWPQIWERNSWILDAHWIYPGDPLDLGLTVEPLAPSETLTDGGAVAVDTDGDGTADTQVVDETPSPGEESLIDLEEANRGTPQALGFDSDLACSGYLGELEGSTSKIIGSEHGAYVPSLSGSAQTGGATGTWGLASVIKYGLDLGDIVYLDGGESVGLRAGSLYSAVASTNKVRHPLTGKTLGHFVRNLGVVRVLSVQAEGAIAEIVAACDAIPVGTQLVPHEPEPIPLGRRTTPRPVNDPSAAETLTSAPVIVMAKDGVVSLGEDHVVFVDQGAEQDVTPGDIYTVYRMNREGLPPVPVGEIAILSVRAQSAVARIIQSRLPIYIGDRLERK